MRPVTFPARDAREVVRGARIVTDAEFRTIPDQRCSVSRCAASGNVHRRDDIPLDYHVERVSPPLT